MGDARAEGVRQRGEVDVVVDAAVDAGHAGWRARLRVERAFSGGEWEEGRGEEAKVGHCEGVGVGFSSSSIIPHISASSFLSPIVSIVSYKSALASSSTQPLYSLSHELQGHRNHPVDPRLRRRHRCPASTSRPGPVPTHRAPPLPYIPTAPLTLKPPAYLAARQSPFPRPGPSHVGSLRRRHHAGRHLASHSLTQRRSGARPLKPPPSHQIRCPHSPRHLRTMHAHHVHAAAHQCCPDRPGCGPVPLLVRALPKPRLAAHPEQRRKSPHRPLELDAVPH
ncbi:unnamed protein product [Chondrus crispus]|uniref:Uncharacterized protein n=1 Tax=Chondrus crispus TaxID=2769 RepID=R7Q6Q2_CHOCR|nr:unnamed protein product [Chondrus crispus]CDF33478.1 unnamed protein product [Chondrus crispus]|eukprot:XP_005713281.1 unnamed protein product [Chondrus crispus]